MADNSDELRIAFLRDWISRKGDRQRMAIIRVHGDNMEPTLYSGDVVLVDMARNVIEPSGGIYAVAFPDDTIMIKRVQMLYSERRVRIISDNTRYETIEVAPDQVIINGKAIWFRREIERQ